MPALEVDDQGIPAAAAFGSLLKELLQEAETLKPSAAASGPLESLEPALNKHDFNNLSTRVADVTRDFAPEGVEESEGAVSQSKARKFALIEAVTRDLFSKLTASTPIESAGFGIMWNFLDIIYMISDDGHCEPALLFWLIEELLESQTIPGCQIIFDYLESRRERITAKHTKSTDLVILRSCNELLRRLSRAEDTAFCGRVFIFLFQSFPLGDRSSVNLRGEYHVENVTAYEKPTDEKSKMEIDTEEDQKETTEGKEEDKGDKKRSGEPLSSDELYGLFWPLQECFSQPLTLFEPATFKKFQLGVEETVKKFRTYPSDEGLRSSSAQEDAKQNLKRKRDGSDGTGQAEAFNPKYLTSKDLFDLEIGDLTFRRHILVQILIVLNFVLSWTPEAKKKYEKINVTNKSVIYPGEFNEEDAKWALATKTRVADYMRKDTPGRIFHRMVDTVLARDKNWVYWKMASCEPIQRDPVTPEVWADAQSAIQKAATNKRLRPVPLNAVPMDFLADKDRAKVMEELKNPERYSVPDLDTFKVKISDDDFDMSMASDERAKARIAASKASKSWRALRIARGFKLAAFDKIDDPNDVSAVFEPLEDPEAGGDADETAPEDSMPTNRETIVITGPAGVGKSALVNELIEAHTGVFGRVVRHTTREPSEGESSGQTYHFVKAQEFNQLRDGDRLVEYTEEGDVSYGTSSKAIEAVSESGKVPIIEMSLEAATFAKDMMDFPARYVFIKPASPEALETRLTSAGGRDDAAIKSIVDGLPAQLDDPKLAELFDQSIINDDLSTAGKSLAEYIFEKTSEEPGGDEADKGEAQHMEVDGGAAAES